MSKVQKETEEKEEEFRFISPVYDTTIKYLFRDDECGNWLKRLIYLIT